MVLIYGSEPRPGGQFSKPISEWSPEAVLRAWKTHVENRKFLFFMYTKGTVPERQQASRELDVCDRKIAFWERHPNFDKVEAGVINSRLKREWQSPAR